MKKKVSQVKIEDFSKSEGIWHYENINNSDIVLKSSMRFFRNVNDYRFPNKLNKKEKDSLNAIIVENIMKNSHANELSVFNLNAMPAGDKRILFERNIIENERGFDGFIIIASNQNNYFIINNNEHIEWVITKPGLQVESLFVYGKKVVFELGERLNFSFSPRFGYLTANPDHSGSAIEFFITLHLPGLIFSSEINKIITKLEKLDLGIRASWIEGYYEVYNKKSLGIDEKEIYKNILNNIFYVISREKKTREAIYKKNQNMIDDKVWRSYGTLISSRLLSLFEALELLSNMRLGIYLGIMNYLTIKDINLLLYFIQDFHLRKRYNIGDHENLEEVRAQFIRDYLKGVVR